MRPKPLCDVVIGGRVTYYVNELSRGDTECTENSATHPTSDLILANVATRKCRTCNIDHAWEHAQTAKLLSR